MRHPFLTVLLAVSLFAAPAMAQTPTPPTAQIVRASDADFRRAADAVLGLARAASEQPGASPALSVVLVQHGRPPLIWTHGRLSADPGSSPAGDHTPFYIASQTKAFIGLLAVKLHAEGVFDLDQTLAGVWPDVTLPPGADPAAITFRQLLSHQGPFENEVLSSRTAYSDRVPAADYARLLSTGSEARAPGYDYSNLGYLLYGAALELKTGRDWRDWLDQALFQPAGMTRSGGRPSRFDGLPSYHRWMGERGWDAFAGKPDDLMHAAGGLVMSPNDMARWLAIQLGEVNDAVRPERVQEARTQLVAADIQGDVIACQGYALGWNVCRLGAVDIRAHGGSYTGVRSAMAVSPELGVAIAVFSTSDSLTGGLSQTLVQTFFESVQDPARETPSPEAFGARYAQRLADFAGRRMAQVDQRRAEDQWRGWAWRPTAADRAAYAGRYRHPTLGDYVVSSDGEAVHARLGVVDRVLEPAAADLFATADGLAGRPMPVRFERTDGRVTAVVRDDERFERVD
jgi:CubicO group peptidase (beta-lactamase class C family)